LIYSKIPHKIQNVQRLGYGLESAKIVALIIGQVRGHSFQKSVQTVIEAHLASNTVAAGTFFLRTIRPETEADHYSPTNIRFMT
jgi:hypothetical protein